MLLEYSVFLKYDPASQIHASVGTVPNISVNGAPYQIVLDCSGDDEKHGGVGLHSSAPSTLTVLRTIKSTYFGIEEMCVVKSPSSRIMSKELTAFSHFLCAPSILLVRDVPQK